MNLERQLVPKWSLSNTIDDYSPEGWGEVMELRAKLKLYPIEVARLGKQFLVADLNSLVELKLTIDFWGGLLYRKKLKIPFAKIFAGMMENRSLLSLQHFDIGCFIFDEDLFWLIKSMKQGTQNSTVTFYQIILRVVGDNHPKTLISKIALKSALAGFSAIKHVSYLNLYPGQFLYVSFGKENFGFFLRLL